MNEHDPLCQFSNLIPGVSAWCTCPALRRARADEREKNARALEARGGQESGVVAVAFADAAWIVRNGGSDDDA